MVKIDEQIKQGTHEIRINNSYTITRDQLNQLHKELFKKALKDEEYAEIMSAEENMQKIKHRIITNTSLHNKDGDIIAIVTSYNNKTIRQALMETLTEIQENTEVNYQDHTGLKMLKKEGYLITFLQKGTVTQATTTIKLLKGK